MSSVIHRPGHCQGSPYSWLRYMLSCHQLRLAMAPDILRDSFLGQIIRLCSSGRLLRYPEEKPGFVVPEPYLTSFTGTTSPADEHGSRKSNSIHEQAVEARQRLPPDETPGGRELMHPHGEKMDVVEQDAIIVDWYGPDDPECPLNWSLWKRAMVTFEIAWLTFAIYIGAALFAPGIPDLMEKFGVSRVAASLGLSMFILGYAFGPMLLSPMSEIPHFGRAPVYIITLGIFVALQVPTALAKNLGALLPLRFLAGFIGSPPLATGAASLADMWPRGDIAAVLGVWAMMAMTGPTLGPLIGGFAAQAKGWTWTVWILLWLTGATFVWLAVAMPETSSQAILYRRALRLRRLTGNPNIKSQGEIDAEHMTIKDIALVTLYRPFVLGFLEPVVLFWNLYMGLIYGILYCFVSSYDIVFIEKHHFNLGQNGLTFLGIIIGVSLCLALYLPWAMTTLKRKIERNTYVPEDRMPLACICAFFFPISMFWFGWTSGGNIHWIVPMLASVLWAGSAFALFQAGLNYLADCYPRYVASVMASNDLFRSCIAAAFPLFTPAFFHNLRVGPALSIIGGIGVLMIPVPFLLMRYGAQLRSWSKYAD